MKKLSREDWINKANIAHNFKYEYPETLATSPLLIVIKCSKHGLFEQNKKNHIYGGRGCPKCNGGTLLSKEDWIDRANYYHNGLYSYSKVVYSGMFEVIVITCPFHGDFEQISRVHLTCGCPACFGLKRIDVKLFMDRANEIHNHKYDYSLINEIENVRSYVNILCEKHGSFIQRVASHLAGHGCRYCAISNSSSKKEKLWLDHCGVPNDLLHRNVFITVGDRKFNVDGYYAESKIVYEFLGDYWHGNPLVYSASDINLNCKKTFGELFRETRLKLTSLKEHGFEVISIWESEFDDVYR